MSDYQRIASAIDFMVERATDQPGLHELAAHLHMSPFHFQRLFCRWAGITPKRFLQVITLEKGKTMLRSPRSLLEVSNSLGLSSGSRLYDHFVQLESVTPGEYKAQGEGLTIEYGRHSTAFGDIFIASTQRGVCRATFPDDTGLAVPLAELQSIWPRANILENNTATQAIVDRMFSGVSTVTRPLSLHVAGTNFQIAVWQALLRIPPGTVVSYSHLANAIGKPRSARAIGNAMGANPIAYLIPCHRVIQQTGAIGGYRWGDSRKRAMQLWEAAQWDDDQVHGGPA